MRHLDKAIAAFVLFALSVTAAPRPDVAASLAILERADGTTDHELVASALDSLRASGRDAAPATAALTGLLRHQSKLYTDRDKTLVVRLRSYVMVTLSDVGYPSGALPALLETLANLDQRMPPVEAGAAARAAGSLGTGGRPFVPYLVAALTVDRFDTEEFSLDRYVPLYPPEEATTVRLEAIRALGRICSSGDVGAIEALGPFTTAADPRVAREAARAVTLIQKRRPR